MCLSAFQECDTYENVIIEDCGKFIWYQNFGISITKNYLDFDILVSKPLIEKCRKKIANIFKKRTEF